MPINFITVGTSAFDEESGIIIPAPRAEPFALEDGTELIEYQYTAFREREPFGRFSICGTRSLVNESQGRAWVYFFHLTEESGLGSILNLRERFATHDDEYSFLRGMAKASLGVFTGMRGKVDAQRMSIVTTLTALMRRGIHVPPEVVPDPEGRILLAEVLVPARPPRQYED